MFRKPLKTLEWVISIPTAPTKSPDDSIDIRSPTPKNDPLRTPFWTEIGPKWCQGARSNPNADGRELRQPSYEVRFTFSARGLPEERIWASSIRGTELDRTLAGKICVVGSGVIGGWR
jgi:hypothetical protein